MQRHLSSEWKVVTGRQQQPDQEEQETEVEKRNDVEGNNNQSRAHRALGWLELETPWSSG